MTQHVMVDLETLGLTPDSVILSIGAVVFTADAIHSKHHWVLDLYQPGRQTDAGTVKWWFGQSDAARNAIINADETWMLYRAIDEFNSLFDAGTRIWSNGANFDIPILENVYASAFDQSAPWKYKNTRCYRTVRAMFPGIDNEVDSTAGTEHNALDDAMHQTRVLQYACSEKGFVLP